MQSSARAVVRNDQAGGSSDSIEARLVFLGFRSHTAESGGLIVNQRSQEEILSAEVRYRRERLELYRARVYLELP